MNIIYSCSGGTHSSVVASYIHLGVLPIDRVPTKEEILKTPFDQLEACDIGRIIYRGTDELDNKVFTLSKRNAGKIVIPALIDLNRLLGHTPDSLQVVNTLPAVNTLMRIGGFTSRRLKLVNIGRPIVLIGTLQTYHNLAYIVKSLKDTVAKIKKT